MHFHLHSQLVSKSEPARDENGRFASKMYRGHGKGSSTTGALTWVTPDKDTAKGYADHREDGVVSELDVEMKNTFDAGHDTRKLTPSKFAIEVLTKAKAAGLVDDKTALALRSEFMKDQPKEEVAVHSLWADEEGKARVSKLLSGAGFDSVSLTEQGKPTYGLLKKQDGFLSVFKANPYHDERGRFSDSDKAKFVSIGGVFDKQRAKASAKEPAKPQSPPPPPAPQPTPSPKAPTPPKSPTVAAYQSGLDSAKSDTLAGNEYNDKVKALSESERGTEKEVALREGAASSYASARIWQLDCSSLALKLKRTDISDIHKKNAEALQKLATTHHEKASAIKMALEKAKEPPAPPPVKEPPATHATTAATKPPPSPDSDVPTLVAQYTKSGGSYQEINSGLRTGKDLTGTNAKTVAALDKLFETDALPFTTPLYRGMSGFEPSDLGLMVGAEFKDNGFVSTAADSKVAKKFATYSDSGVLEGEESVGTLFKITGSKKTKVLDLRGYSNYGEEEFLLPRGSKFKVTGIKLGVPGKSLSQVSMKVIDED